MYQIVEKPTKHIKKTETRKAKTIKIFINLFRFKVSKETIDNMEVTAKKIETLLKLPSTVSIIFVKIPKDKTSR
jgi:hypothetical protein